MSHSSTGVTTRTLLVLPHLRVQNANAISSPLTHGFPSITALTGLMWALQRELAATDIPLRLRQVGVVCHDHEEQVADGYVKTFRLTRNPVDKDGNTAAIVEEGRIHLEVTILFLADLDESGVSLASDTESQLAAWAAQVGEIVARMRFAGGTLLPVRPMPGRRTRPWIAVLPETLDDQTRVFARWRRQWLPGYVLVGRDDLLADRHRRLRESQPDASLLDAWLHVARFNHQPCLDDDAERRKGDKLRWMDPDRPKGAGWIVPIPVGYAALSRPQPAGAMAHARDASIPSVFVESVYSMGQWISPHRLNHVHEMMWRPETDVETGLYRCRSGYMPDALASGWTDDALPDFE
jgi:CRISPR-associated protein Csy2